MGNFFCKKNKLNRSIENSLLLDNLVRNQFDIDTEEEIDYDNESNLFENKNIEIDNINKLVSYCKKQTRIIHHLRKKINLIETEQNETLQEYNLANQNNLFTVNEQINLIHKDLKILLNNDKILMDKYGRLDNNDYELNNDITFQNNL